MQTKICLYKYKSLLGDGFLHAVDMIVNERIFLSTRENMNDPEEGHWQVCGEHFNSSKHFGPSTSNNEELCKSIDSQRFTCFSDKATDPLLWAHYAGGFRGVVFQYILDTNQYDIREVKYENIPVEVTRSQLEQIVNEDVLPQEVGILNTKAPCWEYESEYRLFGNDSNTHYLNNIKPASIILGVKNTKYDEAFSSIAATFNVGFLYLLPGDDGSYHIVDPEDPDIEPY